MENPAIWDYRDPYIWMEKIRNSEMPPTMIAVALTGGVQGKEYNPNLPETAEEQIEAAYEAYQAGAVSVHIHARNPDDPTVASIDSAVYTKINEGIRKRCPGMIINNSTGAGPQYTPKDKLAGAYADVKPDMCSLNPGPFMMDLLLKERPAELGFPREKTMMPICIPMVYDDVRSTAKSLKELGIRPEIEVFNHGHFWVVNDLISKGLIDPPYVLQFIFGFQTAVYPTPWNVINMINEMPKDSIFFVPGVGVYQLPLNVMGLVMGGHVRVGLEDNVYFKRGELAKNSAQQVERIRRISEEMNRPIATCEQARKMLGLKPV